jgi:hypothetical protein
LPRDPGAPTQRAGPRCRAIPVIDHTRTWAAVGERLASETDPALIHNLELVLSPEDIV